MYLNIRFKSLCSHSLVRPPGLRRWRWRTAPLPDMLHASLIFDCKNCPTPGAASSKKKMRSGVPLTHKKHGAYYL